MVILQMLLCISQKDCEELEELYENTNKSLRNLDIIYSEIINELKDNMHVLQEKLIEKDWLYKKLEEACKETILHYERENLKLKKERVVKKKFHYTVGGKRNWFLLILDKIYCVYARINCIVVDCSFEIKFIVTVIIPGFN